MRNIFFAAMIASIAFSSCGNAGTETASEGTKEEQHEAMAPGTQMDPVCEMAREAEWTDFSVQGGDTTWFCSDGCKQAFEARPEKYKAKG